MKTLFLFTLCVVLSISLNARENPFESKDHYEEMTGKILDSNDKAKNPEAIQEQQFINENKNKVDSAVKKIESTLQDTKPAEKTYSKQEVDSLIQKTKAQTKEMVKKEVAKVEPEQVVYVKPRTDIAETMTTKKLLPAISAEFSDNKLILHTEYKVFKKFTVEQENKLIIDFATTTPFNPKKEEFESKNFKRVALGNHSADGFCRVAIELLNKPTAYDVVYQENQVIITAK